MGECCWRTHKLKQSARYVMYVNLLRTHLAVPRESTKFWPLWWPVSLSIRILTTLYHIRFVLYHNIGVNEINICLDNWKHRLVLESAHAALCKWAICTRQIFRSKTFTNSLNIKKQYNVYVIKQKVNAIACTIELWMHFGGLLSTQEARVALGYRLVRLLRFFRA